MILYKMNNIIKYPRISIFNHRRMQKIIYVMHGKNPIYIKALYVNGPNHLCNVQNN